jgi:hypothetical protein
MRIECGNEWADEDNESKKTLIKGSNPVEIRSRYLQIKNIFRKKLKLLTNYLRGARTRRFIIVFTTPGHWSLS